MSARIFLPTAAGIALGLLLATACGGNDEEEVPAIRLTDPDTAPTATPWTEPPESVILDGSTPTPDSESEDEEGDGEVPEESDGEGISSDCGETYVVEAGDYPFKIAENCGVAQEDIREWVDELLRLNGIEDPTTLSVGQELQVPQ